MPSCSQQRELRSNRNPHKLDHSTSRNLASLGTSDMQGLIWGEPELAHKYDFDVENNSNAEESNISSVSVGWFHLLIGVL